MSRRIKLGGLAVGVVLAVIGIGSVLRRPDPGSLSARKDGDGRGVAGFRSGVNGVSGAEAPPPTAPPPTGPVVPDKVTKLMSMWRAAILARDPDTVLFCDQAFLDDRLVSGPALVVSAENDSNETVRAFSTRMLGKFADPALTGVFRKLLADQSPYVRENAAWALGELSSRDAIKELEKMRKRDSAENVRKSAADALEKVRGKTPPQVKKG